MQQQEASNKYIKMQSTPSNRNAGGRAMLARGTTTYLQATTRTQSNKYLLLLSEFLF